MTQLIRVYETGDKEVMKWESMELADPGHGEIQIAHTAIGLNFIDVYFRTGTYPAPLPFTPGLEAAGIVEKIGAGVEDLKVGDRVAYAATPLGAYAESRNIEAAKVVKIPDGVEDNTAAAMMLKGMTAQYLLRSTFEVKAGDTILFHAAAGGVGLIACQWAKHLGATVIGTVGSKEKAELARQNGCDHPIIYTQENFVEKVQEITDGKGVPVVYDSVGQSTFMSSLDCLQPRGAMVLFGQSSGKVEPFDVSLLSAKGSLYLTRPTLFHYTATRPELVASANELFDVVASGAVNVSVNQEYALSNAIGAHCDLENRQTTGSSVLIP
ncbi:MAG: NADPH:quinone reductase [Gammaproteobacteria bacterium]|nr:NADPH:quinone reductase [Gammaproteobacteria bacterium]